MWNLVVDNKDVEKYKVVKCGRRFQVCKVLDEFQTRKEAMDFMLDEMNARWNEKKLR